LAFIGSVIKFRISWETTPAMTLPVKVS